MWKPVDWIAGAFSSNTFPQMAPSPSALPTSQQPAMNLTANRASYSGPEESKLSWDWTALDRASPIELAAATSNAASNRKRDIEGFGIDGTGSSSHKRFKNDTLIHAQFSKPVLSTQSTTKAPGSSSTRPSYQSSLDFDLSKAGTSKSKPQAPRHFKTQGPFIIINSDDSDDEVLLPVTPARRPDPPVERPSQRNPAIGQSSDFKITQRIESQRRREEAKRRHDESFTSSSTFGRNEDAKPPVTKRDPNQTETDGNAGTVNDGSRLFTFAKSLTSNAAGSHAKRSTSSSSRPLIKSESRTLPATVPQAAAARAPVSKVIDLTEDDLADNYDEAPDPPTISQPNGPAPAHDRKHSSTGSAQEALLNIRAKEQGEKIRQEDQKRKYEEAASKARAAELRQQARQQQQKDQRQTADLVHHQHDEEQRSKEQQRLSAERLARERALKQHEHTRLPLGHNHQSYVQRQQPERQLPGPQEQHDYDPERRLRDQLRERELAEQREMDQRRHDLNKARERQRLELAKDQERKRQEQLAKELERERQDRVAKEQERQRQQQRGLAEQQDMKIRKAAFDKAKAEAEQKQAEEKLQDRMKFEREKREGFGAKPIAEFQREQQLEINRSARIQKQQDRNAQNRARDDDDARTQQQAYTPIPQSLSSLARSQPWPTPGREAVVANNRSGTVLTSQAHEQPAPIADEFRKIKMGEITYEDTQLLKWKDESDHSWSIIRQNFTSLLHSPKATNTLRLRYNDVTALLKQAGVGPETMSNLYQGGDDVLREVNKVVDDFRFTPLHHETKARRKQQQETLRQQNAPPQRNGTAAPKKSSSLIGKLKRKPSNAFPFTGVRNSVVQPPPAPRNGLTNAPVSRLAPPIERPTMGGKRLDEAFFYKMLEDQAQVWHEMVEESEESEEDEDIDEADHVYWVYVVQRREWLPEDLERCENNNEEQPEWIECDGEYEEIGLANTVASHEVMRITRGRPAVLDPESDFDLHCKVCEDNMKSFTVETDRGKVETAVARRLRTYMDRIPPKSRQTWRPTTVYQVMKRITTQVVDEVLDETKEKIHEEPLGDRVYFALEQANEVAAHHFVKLTFASDSNHLTVRTVEQANQVKAMVESLDDADLLMLEGVGGQHGSVENTEVKVWVLKLQAVGPRN